MVSTAARCVDRMLDEDYYGRGVCHWEFTGAGAMLKATGAEEDPDLRQGRSTDRR